jgi:hypothetical protein
LDLVHSGGSASSVNTTTRGGRGGFNRGGSGRGRGREHYRGNNNNDNGGRPQQRSSNGDRPTC